MITLLCGPAYRSPARGIGGELAQTYNQEVQVISTGKTEARRQRARTRVIANARADNSVLIRYGTTAFSKSEKKFALVLNTAEAVANASNKYDALNVLREGQVPVIPHTTVAQYLGNPLIQHRMGPIIIGRTFHHFGGKDIRVIDIPKLPTQEALLRALDGLDYVMKLIPNTKEYRVWAYHTRSFKKAERARPIIFKAAEKQDKGGIDRAKLTGAKTIVKNHHNGYAFVFHEGIPEAVRELGRKALGLFDLDFAAIDIMHDLDTDTFYVLELNTAPGCASQATTEAFAKKFDRSARYLVGGEVGNAQDQEAN